VFEPLRTVSIILSIFRFAKRDAFHVRRHPETLDYKSTLNLPQDPTFPCVRSPKREPEWLRKGRKNFGVYDRFARKRAARRFTLHDGPPLTANGHRTSGTREQDGFKDMIVRSHQMIGFDARYIPVGIATVLPIEWKIEEQYRKKVKTKTTWAINDFRAECRKFCRRLVDVQRGGIQNALGITGMGRSLF